MIEPQLHRFAGVSGEIRLNRRPVRNRESGVGRNISAIDGLFLADHLRFYIVIIHENLQTPWAMLQIPDLEGQLWSTCRDCHRPFEETGTHVARERDKHISIEISCARASARCSFQPPVGIPESAVIVDVEVFEILSLNGLARDDQRIAFEPRTIGEQVLPADLRDAARQIIDSLIDGSPRLSGPR